MNEITGILTMFIYMFGVGFLIIIGFALGILWSHYYLPEVFFRQKKVKWKGYVYTIDRIKNEEA